MSRRFYLTLGILALMLLISSASWAAIGIYQWSIGTGNVPAPVSYMLNTDATQVTIEVQPTLGGAAVKTWTFTAPAAECTKGPHDNVVIWDGNTDGGTPAPAASYDIVITATAAAVAGTDLQPVWEDSEFGDSSYWADAAVNMNEGSPYFGYVYGTNWGATNKGIHMWKPDGTYIKKVLDDADWGYSGPWSVRVGDDDKVYVTSYSRYAFYVYTPDLTSHGAKITIEGWKNPRWMDAVGSGGGFKMVTTYWQGSAIPGYGWINWITGDPPTPQPGVGVATGALMQPAINDAGSIFVPEYHTASPDPDVGGSLVEITSGGAILQQNPNIHRGMGCTITPDGQYLWLSRYVDSTYSDTDSTAFYKIDASQFTTADPYAVPEVGLEKFGINCAPAGKWAGSIQCDPFGNICAAAGTTGYNGFNRIIGLYAPPDSGSTDVRTAGTVSWGGDASPEIVSATLAGDLRADGTPVLLTVVAQDEQGYADIGSVKVDLSQIGGGVSVPLNGPVSNDGNKQATFELEIAAAPGTPAGVYSLPLTANDVHAGVPAGTGSVDAAVVGGWITGVVTNSMTNLPVENAAVTASQGGVVKYQTTTNADGSYHLLVANDVAYSVTASKASHKDDSATPVPVTVALGATVADVNFTLAPKDIFHAKYSWIDPADPNNATPRPSGQVVCVTAVIMRAAADAASAQQGYDGYFYISDTSKASTQQGIRVNVRAGDPVLHEGDRVVVEGEIQYMAAAELPEGYIIQGVQAYVVETGQTYPDPGLLAWSMETTWHGRFWTIKAAEVVRLSGTDAFIISLPRYVTNPTTFDDVAVKLQTPATTGLVLPAAGDKVDITAVAAQYADWGSKMCLVPCRPPDLKLWVPVIINDLAAIKNVADGEAVYCQLDTDPVVVTYADPGEKGGLLQEFIWVMDKDRTTGLKLRTDGTTYGIYAGDEITYMEGKLSTPVDAARELLLSSAPTYTMGTLANIPAFLSMNARSFGGGWLGEIPGVIQGVGLNTDGLLVRVAGKSYGYGSDTTYEWFYLDDGSGMPNEGGYSSIKVIRSMMVSDYYLFPTVDGTNVIAEGICTSQWVSGVGRVRVLHIRYDGLVSDQVQILP